MPPKISVLTATYNRPHLLREAVQSILAQTFTDLECIVINDGGQDVGDLLAQFHDPRLVYLNLPANHGKAYALNRGVEAARGEYLAYLDDDDHFYPHHLETLLHEIESHPEVDLVYSDFEEVTYEFDAQGRRQETERSVKFSMDFDRVALLRQNFIPHPTVLHRKEILRSYGGFNENYSCLIDWELFHRLAFYCEFRHIHAVTGEYFRNEEKGGHITNLLVTRREFYLDHFYGTRRQLPPRPWTKVIPVSLVIKVNPSCDNLAPFLYRLVDATQYPCEMFLLVGNQSELLKDFPNPGWLRRMNIEIIHTANGDDLPVAARRASGDVIVTLDTTFAPSNGWLWPLVKSWSQQPRPIRLGIPALHSLWGWVMSREETLQGVKPWNSPTQTSSREFCQVSIIIPVRNKLEFTRQCLDSVLRTHPFISYEIIVVDNASDDGSKEFLENLADQGVLVHLINDPPLPFAASCNRGASAAQGKYLLFLNNDTLAFPGWLEELYATAESSPDVGAVGAKLMYPDRTIQHAGVAVHHFKKKNLYYPYHIFWGLPAGHPAVNKIREIKIVTGACLMTPKAVFEGLGGFDERYINCFEDVDYCLNLRSRGYRVIYNPRAELIHFEGQTPGRNDNINPSSLVLQEKWGGRLSADDERFVEGEDLVIMENDTGGVTVCELSVLNQWKEALQQLIDLQQWGMVAQEMSNFEMVAGSEYPDLLVMRGHYWLGLNEVESAQQAFREAQRLSPQSAGPKWGLALTALAKGKSSEAHARLRRLISDHPDDPHLKKWHEALAGAPRALADR